uniref:RING finger protein 141 n=6 Tax=Boreoeutheria TaxID=1437010 RepID=A0A8C0YX01_CANLF
MGQQFSDQTQLVLNKLPEKVAKHVTLVRESGSLTYEEFLGRVAELNDITAKVASGQEKHLLFEVQPGSDSSAFWKVVVRVVCTKINKSTGIVEASRIMNLYQFIQLYKDITSQASGVLAQSSTSEDPDENSSSVTSCQASLWMGRVKQLTDEEECCICMDGRADLILPCAHSFCQKCIDKWSRSSLAPTGLYLELNLSKRWNVCRPWRETAGQISDHPRTFPSPGLYKEAMLTDAGPLPHESLESPGARAPVLAQSAWGSFSEALCERSRGLAPQGTVARGTADRVS